MKKEYDYKELRRLLVANNWSPLTQQYEKSYYYDLPIATKLNMLIEEFGRQNIRKVYTDVTFLNNSAEKIESALGNTISIAISIYLRGEIIGGVREADFPLVENLRVALTGHPMESDGALANKVRGLALSQALTDLGYRLPEAYNTVTQDDIDNYENQYVPETISEVAKPEVAKKDKPFYKNHKKKFEPEVEKVIDIENPFEEDQSEIAPVTGEEPKNTVIEEKSAESQDIQADAESIENNLFNMPEPTVEANNFNMDRPSFIDENLTNQKVDTKLEKALDVKFEDGFLKGQSLRTLSETTEGKQAINLFINNGEKMNAKNALPERVQELYNACLIVKKSW